jgi:hypothetical protein
MHNSVFNKVFIQEPPKTEQKKYRLNLGDRFKPSSQILNKNNCIVLSIVIVSSGIIGMANKNEQVQNVAFLNITHTESYEEKKVLFESQMYNVYSKLHAPQIFPVAIYRYDTLKISNYPDNLIDNLNEYVYNDTKTKIETSLKDYQIKIISDNFGQNVPYQNYILDIKPVQIFLEQVEKFKLNNVFRMEILNTSNGTNLPNFTVENIQRQIMHLYFYVIYPFVNNSYTLKIIQIDPHRLYLLSKIANTFKRKRCKSNEQIDDCWVKNKKVDFLNIDISNTDYSTMFNNEYEKINAIIAETNAENANVNVNIKIK